MELVVICSRHVDENFEEHEDLVGLHALGSYKGLSNNNIYLSNRVI